MPLNWGCSLQPIHGSCGIRLLQQFWPALPKLFGSSAVSPLTLSLNSIRPVIQTWFAEWTFQEPPIFTFGIVWRITNYRSIQTPSLCTFSQLHPSFPLSSFPSVLHPSPAYPTLLLSPSPSFPFFAWLFQDWFIYLRTAELEGKHRDIFVSCWGWTCFTVDDLGSLFGFTCSHLHLLPPQHYCVAVWYLSFQDRWTSPVNHFSRFLFIGANVSCKYDFISAGLILCLLS